MDLGRLPCFDKLREFLLVLEEYSWVERGFAGSPESAFVNFERNEHLSIQHLLESEWHQRNAESKFEAPWNQASTFHCQAEDSNASSSGLLLHGARHRLLNRVRVYRWLEELTSTTSARSELGSFSTAEVK